MYLSGNTLAPKLMNGYHIKKLKVHEMNFQSFESDEKYNIIHNDNFSTIMKNKLKRDIVKKENKVLNNRFLTQNTKKSISPL